jgi:hypothetical protein
MPFNERIEITITPQAGVGKYFSEVRRQVIRHYIYKCNGNVCEMCRMMGIATHQSLARMIKELGLMVELEQLRDMHGNGLHKEPTFSVGVI